MVIKLNFLFTTIFLLSTNVWSQGLTYTTKTGALISWKKLPVKLCINESVPIKFRNQIKDAMNFWNESFKTKFFEENCLSKVALKDLEKLNDHSIFWVKSGFAKFTEKTSVARTLYEANEDTGEILDADILINAEYFDWGKINAELKTVLIHELGHFLGLKHDFMERDSVMNYFPYLSGYKITEFGRYEKNAIPMLYAGKKWEPSDYVRHYFANDINAAIDSLKKIPLPSNDEMYSLGYLLKSKNKHDEAVNWFRKYLVNKPDDLIAQYLLGDTLWSLDKTDEAKAIFEKCLEKNPKDYESAANLGVIWSKKGDFVKAEKYFKQSLSNNPAHYLDCMYLYQLTKKKEYQKCETRYSPE